MQIVQIEGFNARCEAKGTQRDVSLFMLQDDMPEAGDYVLVHLGYARQTMTEAEARGSWELLDQLLAQG